ncbi:hypothetical protein niasHT_036973 [Heterodera trifolii]|uniref:Uncharacterized protein n=1 Tax=Heterodera trifolii TaxID=157864 RepID=A0ABD2ILF0_9BILA
MFVAHACDHLLTVTTANGYIMFMSLTSDHLLNGPPAGGHLMPDLPFCDHFSAGTHAVGRLMTGSHASLLKMDVQKTGKNPQRRPNPDLASGDFVNAPPKRRRNTNSSRLEGNPPQEQPGQVQPSVLMVQQQQPVLPIQQQQQKRQFVNQSPQISFSPFVDPQLLHQPQQLPPPATRISISYSKPFTMVEQQQQQQQQGEEDVIRERIRRRQLQELAAMESAKPLPEDLQFCAQYNAYGLTDIGWLLMGWRDQMVIGTLTGVVAESGPMGTDKSKFKGRKLVLKFDLDATQLLSVKEWERHDRASELARAQPRDRVQLQCLNVVSNKAGTTVENTFLFSTTYGQFSTINILAHAGDEWTPTGSAPLPQNVLAIANFEMGLELALRALPP